MFDPPEYVQWNPSPHLDKEYDATIARDEARSKIIAELTQEQLLGMYAGMLRFRLHDITLKRWVKQGILSKAWLGTGEEAATVGPVHALERGMGHFQRDASQLYVSRGIGVVGIPLRIFAPPEIELFELRRSS